MECPICGDRAALKAERVSYPFRKKNYEILEYSFVCTQCNESFSTDELDERNVNQVYNQYRQENGLLFTEEIIELREKYGLSKRKMSLVLGWGENTYAMYEKGAIPNESHNTVLELIKDPRQFLHIISKKKDTMLISLKEYGKIEEKINLLLKENKTPYIYYSYENIPIDEFSGFVKPNYNKLANMVVYFLKQDVSYLVRLNKLLFYSDFLCYKLYKKPISGWNYAAIPQGPVIEKYKFIVDILENDQYLDSEDGFTNKEGEIIDKYVTKRNVDSEILNEFEIGILDFIYKYFKKWKTTKIVDFSHKERGWKENKFHKDLISYQKYADDLQVEMR